MLTDLIYDVGMNDGEDTAYYLYRGFRVVAIEANPVLVQHGAQRFAPEIAAGKLHILNIGIAGREGSLPFWICDGCPEWSSFDRSIASRDGLEHHEITVPCRSFQSVLVEFGVPYYLKLDIEGNEIYCLRQLSGSDLPQYISFEKNRHTTESLSILARLGYSGFKLISQYHFLPVEFPPIPQQRAYGRAQQLLRSTNLIVRIARRAGARRWLNREIARARTLSGWTFIHGSSGPFGDDLLGRWQNREEISSTLAKANAARDRGERSEFWEGKSCRFWADFHAKKG